MKIEQYLEKKKEIIESNRLENRNSIPKLLNKLSSKIESDKDVDVVNFGFDLDDLEGRYIFIITDQFLLCRFIDEIDGYTFSNHHIKESDNNKEWRFNVKSEKSMINSDMLKVVLKAYINDPYFCINYDKETDEYLPSTLYKDLINL